MVNHTVEHVLDGPKQSHRPPYQPCAPDPRLLEADGTRQDLLFGTIGRHFGKYSWMVSGNFFRFFDEDFADFVVWLKSSSGIT